MPSWHSTHHPIHTTDTCITVTDIDITITTIDITNTASLSPTPPLISCDSVQADQFTTLWYYVYLLTKYPWWSLRLMMTSICLLLYLLHMYYTHTEPFGSVFPFTFHDNPNVHMILNDVIIISNPYNPSRTPQETLGKPTGFTKPVPGTPGKGFSTLGGGSPQISPGVPCAVH